MEGQTKKNWYDKNYKRILYIPVVLLVISVFYLFYFYTQTGDVIYKDVSLTGGTTVTVFDESIDVLKLEENLKEKIPDIKVSILSEFRTGNQKGLIVETHEEVGSIKIVLEEFLGYSLTQENSSIEFSGAALSTGFYHQLRFAIILAFLFMAIVVFIIFKSIVPSLAVILSAFADIVMTLALVDFIGIRLSIAGVIAFLMLIGYSVDTDILLTSRVLKRRDGSVNERLLGSFKTGIMMTFTSIAALSVSLLVIYNVSDVLRQIFSILLIGLGFDIFNTWLANAGILKWYVEKKDGVEK